jgi:phage tail sheath protein FI
MPLNLASPGIVVREVDLTAGRVDPTSDKIGAIVSPFAKGPVEEPILVNNEQELLANFGNPYAIDKHYENWLTASSYLAYGGSLRVVRSDNDQMKNAFVGSASSIKIKSYEDYVNLGYDENTISGVTFAARNPGSWANGIKVAIIDAKADQILSGLSTGSFTNFEEAISNRTGTLAAAGVSTITGITTTSISLGQEVVADTAGVVAAGTTVTAIGSGSVTLSTASLVTGVTTTTFDFGTTVTKASIEVGCGVTQAISSILPGAGTTSVLDGYLKGVVTGIVNNGVTVKVISHVSAAGTETAVDYQQSGIYAFSSAGTLGVHTAGQTASYGTLSYTTRQDWFDQQTISLTNSTVSWNNLANRPGTSAYAAARNARFDEVHVVVFDDNGSITGNAGTILEKHLSLSKATDAEFSVGAPSYWRKYLSENSSYIFAGGAPAGITTTAMSLGGFGLETDTGWDQEVSGIKFAASGSLTSTLSNGLNYGGNSGLTTTGSLTASLSDLSSGYSLFENTEDYKVDFLIMGSSGYAKETSQALASKLISVAELRKDAIAFISPYRGGLLTETSTDSYTLKDSATITDNLISYYSAIPSSSYAIFDSGYKYMYDRFSNTFRYVPLNGDIAGLCARNDTFNFPWFSPAGTTRGAILNAVKLAYNPTKSQRDRLYSERINPVIFSPGSGIILFGDKTGLSKASAFDRINVRRLFIYLENAVSEAAKDVMFEFNDSLTRSGFVNTIEPFLRDVQAKRGIQDFRVICDETNNTAAVIDSNEFVADIYIKPNRSINFIGLTFVATRTGVSFEEVIGNV